MGLFNLFSKKTIRSTNPYKSDSINKIYHLLFCDDIDLYKSVGDSSIYPWDTLLSDKLDIDKLKEITIDQTLEAREKILTYNLLSINGQPIDKKELLGVIVEVSLAGGLDVIAAFIDGSARYINHSERMIVWDIQTEESTQLINNLFTDSFNVVNQIGPWDKERRPFPSKGMVRMTFLVSDGFYFGEGHRKVMQNDPMGGPVINSATNLMVYLIQQVK